MVYVSIQRYHPAIEYTTWHDQECDPLQYRPFVICPTDVARHNLARNHQPRSMGQCSVLSPPTSLLCDKSTDGLIWFTKHFICNYTRHKSGVTRYRKHLLLFLISRSFVAMCSIIYGHCFTVWSLKCFYDPIISFSFSRTQWPRPSSALHASHSPSCPLEIT